MTGNAAFWPRQRDSLSADVCGTPQVFHHAIFPDPNRYRVPSCKPITGIPASYPIPQFRFSLPSLAATALLAPP